MMPEWKHWHVEEGRADRVVILRIDRPEARNAMSLEAMEEWGRILDGLETRTDLGCVVLTGTGEGAFVAGGDLKDFARLDTAEAGRQMSFHMQTLLRRWELLPIPTIAAVGANAYGGGCEIALACDLRVMAESAHLVFSQVRLGLTTGWGGGPRLVRLVGYSRAVQILATGQYVNASTAMEFGLVNQIAPQGYALAHALDIARQITRHNRGAVSEIKRTLQTTVNEGIEAGERMENEGFGRRWNSIEHQSAVGKFLARSSGEEK